ncbi:hypothetical protein DERP_005888 [Dermatophagoides pteronyssinus]|uniref:Uncharacterized protein n=1 Tax=Dermatophagoides pteronyssinus TaxID=6956 RepID=A0ABQ8J9V8_DERPT|nr:hypothetical protein DERP_005888 [Dermatophagoides pteronyssinus]
MTTALAFCNNSSIVSIYSHACIYGSGTVEFATATRDALSYIQDPVYMAKPFVPANPLAHNHITIDFHYI